ncbi:hypothetical protein IAR50_006570 [Cryptococcus sp. DSM 104548]
MSDFSNFGSTFPDESQSIYQTISEIDALQQEEEGFFEDPVANTDFNFTAESAEFNYDNLKDDFEEEPETGGSSRKESCCAW